MNQEPKYQMWITEQEGVAQEAQSGAWRLKELTHFWNYPPPIVKVSKDAKILHYKGDRKTYMRQHFEKGIWRSVAS